MGLGEHHCATGLGFLDHVASEPSRARKHSLQYPGEAAAALVRHRQHLSVHFWFWVWFLIAWEDFWHHLDFLMHEKYDSSKRREKDNHRGLPVGGGAQSTTQKSAKDDGTRQHLIFLLYLAWRGHGMGMMTGWYEHDLLRCICCIGMSDMGSEVMGKRTEIALTCSDDSSSVI